MVRSVVAIVVGSLFIGLLSFGADALMRVASPGVFSAAGRVESTPALLFIIGLKRLRSDSERSG